MRGSTRRSLQEGSADDAFDALFPGSDPAASGTSSASRRALLSQDPRRFFGPGFGPSGPSANPYVSSPGVLAQMSVAVADVSVPVGQPGGSFVLSVGAGVTPGSGPARAELAWDCSEDDVDKAFTALLGKDIVSYIQRIDYGAK